jgi:hypothetical protein
VATFNLRLAAIEFCERTRCWRHILNTTVNSANRTVVAPPYAAIHEIEHAHFDGEPLTPAQFSDIDQAETVEEQAGQSPRYITQVTPNTVMLYPFSQAGRLTMAAFLKPRGGNEFSGNPDNPLEDSYDFVPDFLLIQHGEPIAFGALARILALPGQPFSNPAMAGAYLARANAAMETRFSTNMRGQQRAPRRTRFNDF